MLFRSPTDCDDDGDVAEQHDDDGQDPGEYEEVEEVEELVVLVGEGDCVDALPVVGDDWVGLQAEHHGLGHWAEGGQAPAQQQQQPSPVPGGPVGDGEHDGAEPVQRDGHENVAREEVTEDPEADHDLAGDPVGPPRHRAGPGNL